MVILQTLLKSGGKVVSKQDLLDAAWPDLIVVEASLPTAIRKLRLALGDDRRHAPIVETVARFGYRISIPVSFIAGTDDIPQPPIFQIDGGNKTAATLQSPTRPRLGLPFAALVVVGCTLLAAFTFFTTRPPTMTSDALGQTDLHRRAIEAVRRLDQRAIEQLIDRGWRPARPVDREDNDALKMLLGRCEWERDHDQRKLLVMARTLIDGGAKIDHRNIWGDTALSIARAPRYCGAAHPVTRMIKELCYAGHLAPGKSCEADYDHPRPQLRQADLMGNPKLID